ncbi:uncharacterized protein BJX67DRAFT_383039 [Aspergillus lucknowensis]|uniref:F-box domain-containing protein n=1 Tax=Aspergillus lucknowensis TaxID=176173 RepID=A0ABR4LL74_9EURO
MGFSQSALNTGPPHPVVMVSQPDVIQQDPPDDEISHLSPSFAVQYAPEQFAAHLPNEILFEILQYIVHDRDAYFEKGHRSHELFVALKTLHSLIFVSRQFYFAVQPLLYRAVYISHGLQLNSLYRTLVLQPRLAGHVKSFLIHENNTWVPLKKRLVQKWDADAKGARDAALQLALVLLRARNLTLFKYTVGTVPHDDPFQWIFTTVFVTLASLPMGRNILENVEQAEVQRLDSLNRASFLRVLVSLPKLRSLCLASSSPITHHAHSFPIGASQSLRELEIMDPASLANLAGVARSIASLKVLRCELCKHLLLQLTTHSALTETVRALSNNLKELHISSGARCPRGYPITRLGLHNDAPWSFTACHALRVLSVPSYVYYHNLALAEGSGMHHAQALQWLLPASVETFRISSWRYSPWAMLPSERQADISYLLEMAEEIATVPIPSLRTFIFQERMYGYEETLDVYAAVRKKFAERNVDFVFESGVPVAQRGDGTCSWCEPRVSVTDSNE